MSVEKVTRKGADVWRVRWRDDAGSPHSKVCGTKRDADAFDAEVKRRKRMGDLAHLDAGRQTVAEFAQEWWRLYAVINVTERTRRGYAAMFDAHLLNRVGGMRLRDVTPEVIAGLRADLEKGGVGPSATRKALFLLQGMFTQAVAWGHVRTNPVAVVKKPSGKRARPIVVLSPTTVEAMRSDLRNTGRLRDATLVSLLAYAGLRPSEALGLGWGDVRERIIRVERAAADGKLKGTKTNTARSVRLLAPLAADLGEWKLACGRPCDDVLVFPSHDGGLWRDHDWKNWNRRVYRPTSTRAGAKGSRAYDLRHSFCSLLIHEGKTVVEVAAQAGHAPSMTLDTYAHVIAELEGADMVSAESAIRSARDAQVSEKCPPDAHAATG
jgi:integrase